MIEAVEDTPGAVGYFSLGRCEAEGADVKYIALDGVAPSVEAINNGEYDVLRPLGVVVAPPAAGHIGAFLEWAQSDEAIELIESRGFARPQTTTE
jgi:phosphate transport system substrate-binding protein